MAKEKSSKNYGVGHEDANPFYNETHMFRGEKYTIDSPHGSVFTGVEVRESNVMETVIKGTKHAGGARKGHKK